MAGRGPYADELDGPGVPTLRSSKNQVTLPVAAMAGARIERGDRLLVQVEGEGRLVLVRERKPLEEHAGTVPGLHRAIDLDGLRAEWAR